jgi:RimJ/RimL family protein N-acetyltransferase/protein tyrosine phosphatase (PTP) superfamily phosphohydrolase (DUF442 family)
MTQMEAAPDLIEFGTERLRLRRLVASDASFILRLVNEPTWLRFIGDRGIRTLDDARQYIVDGPQRMYETLGLGLLLVERKADAAALGLCGLIKRDALRDVDIGYALLPEYRGHGYAREAAAATLRHARQVRGLERVVAITDPDNAASDRLLRRIGLRPEGMVRLAGGKQELRLFGTTAGFLMDAPSVHRVFDWLWTSGQLTAADIRRLPDLGIEAVVNLALPTASNALPGEADLVTGLGLPFVQIPVPWERPQQQHLLQFFGVLDAFAGRQLWVHCAMNMRVSAFVYLYRRLRRGEPHQQALDPMRVVWEPDRVWREFIAQALVADPPQEPAGTIR